jgi:hypothetical protein
MTPVSDGGQSFSMNSTQKEELLGLWLIFGARDGLLDAD